MRLRKQLGERAETKIKNHYQKGKENHQLGSVNSNASKWYYEKIHIHTVLVLLTLQNTQRNASIQHQFCSLLLRSDSLYPLFFQEVWNLSEYVRTNQYTTLTWTLITILYMESYIKKRRISQVHEMDNNKIFLIPINSHILLSACCKV